jgi:hypothetical protein
MNRRIAHAAQIVALVLALAVVPAAVAAKGGAGAGGSGGGATISFNPGTVSLNQQYQVNLSGLRPDTWVTVGAYYISSDAAYWCSHPSDSAGNWSCTFTAVKAGDFVHSAYQLGNNDRQRLVASATLTVSP